MHTRVDMRPTRALTRGGAAFRLRGLAWLLACAVLTVYPIAETRANGRFPKAQVILTPPGGDGRELVMRTTFGLLFSHDGGAHFGWLCEQSLGFAGTWDPPLAFARNGLVYVGLEHGLRTTRGGCDVRTVPELEGEVVSDLSLMPGGTRAILVTATPKHRPAIWVENTHGSFERRGEGPAELGFETIDVAASDPKRIFATGIDYRTHPYARLFRSDDGGTTVRELSPKLPQDGHIFLSQIDPANRDRVVLRQITPEGSSILVSGDGGMTFHETLRTNAGLYGFAASDDGALLFAASGDPAEGLYRSTDRGEHWTSVLYEGFLCLHARKGQLFACSNPFVKGGFALGRSRDQGLTMDHLASFAEVSGPVACDGGVSCSEFWPKTQRNLSPGAPDDDEPEIVLDASSTHSPVDASSPLDAGAAPEAEARRRGACGCAVPGTYRSDGLWSGLCGLALALAGARQLLDRKRSITKSVMTSAHDILPRAGNPLKYAEKVD